MKTATKLALLTAVLTAAAGLSVCAQPQTPGTDNEGPPRGPRARFGEALAQTLQRYDVNHDGQLDQNEMAALQKDIADGKIQPPRPPSAGSAREGVGPGAGAGGPPHRLPPELLEKYDINKDGKLDPSERAALQKDIEDGTIPPPRGGRGPGHQAQPPSAQDILQRFDADHDGKLDEAELTAFLNSMPRGPRPPHGPDRPLPPDSPSGNE